MQALTSTYPAVYLDVREPGDGLAGHQTATKNLLPQSPDLLGPESIVAVFRSDRPEFIHLKMGLSEGGASREANQVSDAGSAYLKLVFDALMDGCGERMQRGRAPCAVFLQAEEVPPLTLLQLLKNGKFSLDIAGLSLVGASAMSFAVSMHGNIQSDDEDNFAIGYQFPAKVWASVFEKLPVLKYLHLQRWDGRFLVDGLETWLKKNQSLQELHLPDCALDSLSLEKLCKLLRKHPTLKCLVLDGIDEMDAEDEKKLATLLEGTPDLTLIWGRRLKPDSPLNHYRLMERVVCDQTPQAVRDWPEIYGLTKFFPSVSS